tara:strand:+ start:237 stop:461 length:225 start_codon:yes stop_codon:yes gene_type:complete
MKNKDQAKINTIISEIQGFMMEFPPQYETDKESMLGYLSAIICQLDTDIAIKVMEDFGKAGKNQAMAIKVNYGY